MPAVKAALVQQLAAAFDCERYHLHTGHPWLRRRSAGETPTLPDALSARIL
jgi:hypothetical protein